MEVDVVDDQFQDGVAVEQGRDHPGFAVMQRPHRVEQVRADRGARQRAPPCASSYVASVCPIAAIGTCVDDLPDRIGGAGEFGRDGDHADGAAPGVEQGGDRGRVPVPAAAPDRARRTVAAARNGPSRWMPASVP